MSQHTSKGKGLARTCQTAGRESIPSDCDFSILIGWGGAYPEELKYATVLRRPSLMGVDGSHPKCMWATSLARKE